MVTERSEGNIHFKETLEQGVSLREELNKLYPKHEIRLLPWRKPTVLIPELDIPTPEYKFDSVDDIEIDSDSKNLAAVASEGKDKYLIINDNIVLKKEYEELEIDQHPFRDINTKRFFAIGRKDAEEDIYLVDSGIPQLLASGDFVRLIRLGLDTDPMIIESSKKTKTNLLIINDENKVQNVTSEAEIFEYEYDETDKRIRLLYQENSQTHLAIYDQNLEFFSHEIIKNDEADDAVEMLTIIRTYKTDELWYRKYKNGKEQYFVSDKKVLESSPNEKSHILSDSQDNILGIVQGEKSFQLFKNGEAIFDGDYRLNSSRQSTEDDELILQLYSADDPLQHFVLYVKDKDVSLVGPYTHVPKIDLVDKKVIINGEKPDGKKWKTEISVNNDT